MINLQNVTLLGVDCVNIEKLINAADICESLVRFNKTKLLTSIEHSDSRIVPILELSSKEKYDEFIMERLNDFIDTEYVLIIQHDGHLLNPNAWDEKYLDYDYIGAPWGHGTLTNKVGNGGFSLRSKKLLKECASSTFPKKYGGIDNQEDVQICHTHRSYFESKGIKFAPEELASKFSIEGNANNNRIWTHQFGYHDLEQTDTSNFIVPNDNFKFNTFYKYSDKGKTPSAVDKKTIFKNFLKFFGAQNLSVLLDNSTQDSLSFFQDYCPEQIWETQLGNAASCVYLFDKAKELGDHEVVYICEDDYLHASAYCKPLIFEGLQIADYVTLYDHGDKYAYGAEPDTGDISPLNAHVSEGGELTRVLLTRNSHWKHTNSTTMTFASKAKTIKEDYNILRKYCEENKLPNEIPDDFQMWGELIKSGRKLVSSIPGRSTHLCPNGMFSPLIRWDMLVN